MHEISKGSNKRTKTTATSPNSGPSSSQARSRHDFNIPKVALRRSRRAQPHVELEPEPTTQQPPFEPQGTFPFMQLPAELRIHIYHAALARPTPLYLHILRCDKWASKPKCHSKTPLDPAAASAAFRRSVNHHRALDTQDAISQARAGTDEVIPALLRVSKQVYKEAMPILYANNEFNLSLASGVNTLSTLHQRSRSLIKHAIIRIPSHHDLLDGFADLVRLGLRYCWGLKTLKIILESPLPADDSRSGATVSVYANAFHILRWLPRGCSVVLEGGVGERIMRVVQEEGRLMNELDEVSCFFFCWTSRATLRFGRGKMGTPKRGWAVKREGIPRSKGAASVSSSWTQVKYGRHRHLYISSASADPSSAPGS